MLFLQVVVQGRHGAGTAAWQAGAAAVCVGSR